LMHPSNHPPHMTTTPCDAEDPDLNGRISEQQQALADLAIERRRDKLYMTGLRLGTLELEHRIDRTSKQGGRTPAPQGATTARLRDRARNSAGTGSATQGLFALRRLSPHYERVHAS